MRTVGNRERILIEEIVRLRKQGERTAEHCVLSARVSSVRQEQDRSLSRQTARLREAVAEVAMMWCRCLSCKPSFLQERRKGMKKLPVLIGEQAVEVVLIEYPDRL
jgi:predicted site-specific integrase-resolvase